MDVAGRNKSLESLMDSHKPGTARNDVNLQQQQRPQKSIPGSGLEFSNLSYSIIKKQKKDGVWVKREAYLLHDISGQAIKGEIMAIMGPSGAGKSTFLDALAGRIAKGSLEGSVRIDGKPVKINSPHVSCFLLETQIRWIFHFSSLFFLYFNSRLLMHARML